MKYVNYDNNGNILGFYDDGINSVIPIPNIQLTDAQWQSALDNSKIVDITNLILTDKPPVAPLPPSLQEIALYQAENNYINFLILIGYITDTSKFIVSNMGSLKTWIENQIASNTITEIMGLKYAVELLSLEHDIEVNGGTWNNVSWHNL